MKRILLVEDDLSLIGGLSFALKKEGYKAEIARTSLEADALWQDGKYDLVILDVALPDGSGFDLCRKMRRASKVPIMFLTAADEETDMIMGLDIGGDDYITKPFKLAVFLSRVNALLRRSGNFSQEAPELHSHGIRVELVKGEVYKKGEPVELTASEYKLFSIKDNGSGIHPEDLYYIFKRFYRSRYSKDTQGIGLGLPLAKSIIEAHGGDISVDSELGIGTTFYIRFPVQ